jgi:hypothetical protein
VPVDVPGGAHAPALEPPRVEVHLDVLGSRHRAPGAGARAMAIDGEEDGLEGDPARVRAREHGDAEHVPVAAPEVFGQHVSRGKRDKRAAAGGRVDDVDAGEERRGKRAREEDDETEVDVGDGESAGGAWGEREVEARGGGVEWEEDGGVEGLVRRITGRGVGDARRVEEVAEVGWRAGKNAGGAAPAVAGERRAKEVGWGQAAEDEAEGDLREHFGRHRFRLWRLFQRRRWASGSARG